MTETWRGGVNVTGLITRPKAVQPVPSFLTGIYTDLRPPPSTTTN